MPMKGKKKGSAPLLVAPEVLGDELEADMLWDYVKEVDDKPPFMDNTLLGATRSGFNGERSSDGGEATRSVFAGKSRHLQSLRARELFFEAEDLLKDAMANTNRLREDAECFRSLQLSEENDSAREMANATTALLSLMQVLSDTRLTFLEDMEALSDKFLSNQVEALDSLSLLASGSLETEAVFAEQHAVQENYLIASEKYFREHGEYVSSMHRMQEETTQQQEAMLQSMIHRLETGVDEMKRLSVEEMEDKVAQQEEVSRLIVDLLKLQGKSVTLERKTTTTTELRGNLQRMITLEVQKRELCLERQMQLKSEIDGLSEEVKENNLKLLEMTGNNKPSVAYTAALPMVPAAPNTISSFTGSGDEEKNLALLTVEARKDLELATTELASCKDELWALRRHHLLQLNEQYRPMKLDDYCGVRLVQNCSSDAETNAAVRSVVVESLLEVSRCLGAFTGDENLQGKLDRVLFVTSVDDQRAIQDFVAKRINKLLSCVYPTASPSL